MWARGAVRAAALAAALEGCDSQVIERRPHGEDGGGGSATAEPAPTARVEVLGQMGEVVPGATVYVHAAGGTLRSTHASTPEPLDVPADDGDFVSVVWRDDNMFKWRMDTVVVSPAARRLRFHRLSPPLEVNPNAPIRLEIAQALAPGVDEYTAGGPCGGESGWQAEPISLVVESYRGCGYWPTSAIVGMGRDSDGRIVTFDHAEVPHGPAPEVLLLFPSTPVERIEAAVTVAWPASVRVALMSGGFWWSHRGHHYIEIFDGVPAFELTSPFELAFTLPNLGVGTPRVHATAAIGDGDDLYEQEVVLVATSGTSWHPARLRTAEFDADAGTFQMANPQPDAFSETGDAVVVEVGGYQHTHVFWLPVPEDTAMQTVPSLEMPPELAAIFSRSDRQYLSIRHDDRFDDADYAAFVRTGVGAGNDFSLPGEYLESRQVVGRYGR